METMLRIAKYFNASLDDLFGVKEIPEGESTEMSNIEFALSGEIHDLTEAEKQDVLDYVRFKRAQRRKEE